MPNVKIAKTFHDMTSEWLQDNYPGSRLIGTNFREGLAHVSLQISPSHFVNKTIQPV